MLDWNALGGRHVITDEFKIDGWCDVTMMQPASLSWTTGSGHGVETMPGGTTSPYLN